MKCNDMRKLVSIIPVLKGFTTARYRATAKVLVQTVTAPTFTVIRTSALPTKNLQRKSPIVLSRCTLFREKSYIPGKATESLNLQRPNSSRDGVHGRCFFTMGITIQLAGTPMMTMMNTSRRMLHLDQKDDCCCNLMSCLLTWSIRHKLRQ